MYSSKYYKKISWKKETIKELRNTVADLFDHCDELEQYSRRNNLRITGIEEKDGEDTDCLVTDLVKDTLNIPLELVEINCSHRVGKKIQSKPRAILVKFTSYGSRRKLFQAKCHLKNHDTTKGKVFFNDDLYTEPTSCTARSLKKAT